MRKLLYSLVLLLSSFILLNGTVFAQDSEPGSSGISLEEQKMIPPFPGGSTEPFLGQSHFYSYVFRGNGEAVVTVKVVLANTSESEAQKETALRFPNIDPKEMAVYQILGTGQCIRYDTPGFDPGRGGYYPPTCAEYGEPDYYGYYGTSKYQKAEFDFKGDTLTVKLPKEIGPQKSGSFFVYFRAFGIAKKSVFGAFKYKIETLKVDDQINQLTIGINTDSDLFLKGAKGEIDYRFAESDMASLKAIPSSGGAMASPAIDRFIGSVGYGTITKSASNLAPLESYKVNGMYAKSKLGLYAKETTIVLGILLGITILTAVIIRKVFRSINSKDKSGGGDIKQSEDKKSEVVSGSNAALFFTSLGISFIASVMMALYTVAITFLGNYINNFSYQYRSFITLFIVVISFCIYSFFLFAPGIFWGYKKGVGWGIGLIVMTILWLFVFLGITLLAVFFLGNGGSGYPTPLMMKSSFVE